VNYPTNPLFDNNNVNNMQPVKGTTGLALKFAGGIIIAADRRASMGTFVASKHAKKVHKLNEFTGMGIAGLVSDAQSLIDLMKAELSLYELENGFRPTIRVAGSLLATVIHGGYRRYQPYWVQLLVGGVDRRGSHIFVLDPSGSMTEEEYFAIGSGTLLSIGVLEASWKPDMTKAKAKELAITALKTAIRRDTATGNGIDGLIFSMKSETAEEFHEEL
jgi:proteasome beta subunit